MIEVINEPESTSMPLIIIFWASIFITCAIIGIVTAKIQFYMINKMGKETPVDKD